MVPSESTAEREIRQRAQSADRGSGWRQITHQATVAVIQSTVPCPWSNLMDEHGRKSRRKEKDKVNFHTL